MSTMHIVALSPDEQLTIKLLAQNHMKLMVKMYMTDLVASNNEKDAGEKWIKYCRLFDGYEDLTHSMTGAQTHEHAKTKLYNFTSRGMRQLLKMFEIYSPTKSSLEIEAIQIIEECIDKLHAKMTESSRYHYTSDEIKQALGK